MGLASNVGATIASLLLRGTSNVVLVAHTGLLWEEGRA